MYSKFLGFLLLPFIFLNNGFAQEVNSIIIPNRVFFEVGTGISSSTYRDFATSPLFYNGIPITLHLYRTQISQQKESRIGGIFTGGFHYGSVDGFRQTSSFASSLFIDIHQLYRIKRLSNSKWNTKIGGSFNTAINFRNNPSLQNNSFGFETISTLFGSFKISRDLSRRERKQGKISFIHYSLPPRPRKISYQLNLGLINSTFRNGYIYTNQSGVVNDFDPFYQYEFKLFSGYRLGSTLNYTQSLKNKNAIKFSYTWDALRTGGDLDKFEMSNHFLTFSILFSTK